MKKLLLSGMLVGLAASAFGQAQIAIDNIGNDPNGTTAATSGGLFFLKTGAGAAVAINNDFSIAVYGGTDSTALTLIKTFSGTTGVNPFPGAFFDPSGSAYNVPGTTTANTSAFLKIEAWNGTTFASFAAATSGGDQVGSAIFSNPVGAPPNTPPDLTGMPAIILQGGGTVPEPSSFALAGLGAAALLIFRRRK